MGRPVSNVKITVKDTGYNAMLKRLAEAGSLGIGAPGARDGGVTNYDVARWLEQGTRSAPARRWLSSYLEANEARINEMLTRGAQAVLLGKETKQSFLNKLGLKLVGELKAHISKGLPPPNAQSTIKAKGSSVPGINTGQMRASLTHKVAT